MAKETCFNVYFKVKLCAYCGESFKVGEPIIRTKKKAYHKKCWESMLH